MLIGISVYASWLNVESSPCTTASCTVLSTATQPAAVLRHFADAYDAFSPRLAA